MKKIGSKLSIAFVCAILGFMISYQLKTAYKQSQKLDVGKQNAEIIMENEELTKHKKEYEEKISSLQKKIDDYEKSSAGRDEDSKVILQQLEDVRKINGSTDLEGEGITLYITPKTNIFNNGTQDEPIFDTDLLKIVNELYASDAEVISINDIRITGRTGIRTASNSILINKERISFNKQVVIKSIGNKQLLEAAFSFPDNIPYHLAQTCDIKWEITDKVFIAKDNSGIEEFKYAKPLKK